MISLGNAVCIAVEFLTVSFFPKVTRWSLPAAVSRKKSWYKGVSDEEYNTLLVEGDGVLNCGMVDLRVVKHKEATKKPVKKYHCK